MDFRQALYQSYVSSHVGQRKSLADPALLQRLARGFRQHYGDFLPDERSSRIADLGCGSGALVWWLQQDGYRDTAGVDGSPEQVDLAHQWGIAAVEQGDVFEFLAGREGYSLLFARDLIEHFDKQSVFDFLLRCREALSPGGRLVLQVPNAESPYFGRVRYGDFTHELAFSAGSMRQLLTATGFADIEVRPWRPAVTSLGSAVRYLAWRVIEPVLKLPIRIESGGGDRIVTMNLIATGRRAP